MTSVLHRAALLTAAALLAAPAGSALADGVALTYRHNLADFGGTIPFMGARVQVDGERDEAYVLDGSAIHIFTPTGMAAFNVPS